MNELNALNFICLCWNFVSILLIFYNIYNLYCKVNKIYRVGGGGGTVEALFYLLFAIV